jgi:hypothetical protein
MHSELIYALRCLPSNVGESRRFFVNTNGIIMKDEMPMTMRPVLNLFMGGYSRSALVRRLHTLSLDMEHFQQDACKYIYPHIDSFRRTNIVSSTVDAHLYNVRTVLEGSATLLDIVKHMLQTYSSDQYISDMLVIIQTRICSSVNSLYEVYNPYYKT